MTRETYYTPEWCPVQTANTDHRLIRCKVAFQEERSQDKKSCKSTNFVTQGWKTISGSCWRKDLIVWQLQSLRNSGSRWRLYYRKPRLKMLACRPENTKTGLTKQIRKSKSCSKRNAPATVICLQNLMIKLPRLHTRLPAVHSRLSLGPCRMICGQDLTRGNNGMLTWVTWVTWVTCAPSKKHWRPSMDPHIRSKPLYALRMGVPCWQTRKTFSSAGQSISRVSSVTDALCRSHH